MKPHYQRLFTLTILVTIVFCLLSIPAVLTDPIPVGFVAWSYYLFALIGQYFLFACLLTAILNAIFKILRSRFGIMVSATALIGLFLMTVASDAKVFAFWRIHINSSLVAMYFSKGGGSNIFAVNTMTYVWIVLGVISFLLIAFVLLRLAFILNRYLPVKLLMIGLCSIYAVAQSSTIYLARQNKMPLLQYTLKIPYFYQLSIANGLQKMGVPIFTYDSLSALLRENLIHSDALHYPLHPLHYHVSNKKLNVLLIVFDSLRYDMVNPINMPHLYKFAQQADQFTHNVSGGDCTRAGIFSLFYGLPPTYWHNALVHHQASIVVRAFQQAHYQLGIFGSAPLIAPAFDRTVFASVKPLQGMTPGKTPLLRDQYMTREMLRFLEKRTKDNKPFFGFMFYDAPHAYNALHLTTPFHPIAHLNYFNVDINTNRMPIFHLYQNAVFANDQLVAKILQQLKRKKMLNNTVVIITADHGQEFNDDHNNYWEHASGFSKYQMRTPLIIAWPHHKPRIFMQETTHFDLAPTLLQRVLGVENSVRDYSVGADYYLPRQNNFLIAANYVYYALITKHVVMQFHDSGLYRFTDLKMHPLVHAKINPPVLLEAVNELRAYSSSS